MPRPTVERSAAAAQPTDPQTSPGEPLPDGSSRCHRLVTGSSRELGLASRGGPTTARTLDPPTPWSSGRSHPARHDRLHGMSAPRRAASASVRGERGQHFVQHRLQPLGSAAVRPRRRGNRMHCADGDPWVWCGGGTRATVPPAGGFRIPPPAWWCGAAVRSSSPADFPLSGAARVR